MSTFIIFPNQVFEIFGKQSYWKQFIKTHNITRVLFVEDPLYFYDDKHRPYKINQLKLAFHRATMKALFAKSSIILKNLHTTCQYIEYNDAINRSVIYKHQSIVFFDPFDHILVNVFTSIVSSLLILTNTMMFLATKEDLQKFHRPKTRHNAFFNMMKNKLNVLHGIPSQDKLNRKSLPKSFKLPSSAVPPSYHSKFHTEASHYVSTHPVFKNHYGSTKLINKLPVTHADAKKHLLHFIQHRLNSFGAYQDAVIDSEPILYHSNISHLLNCGLLTPIYVLQQLDKVKNRIPLQSYEGFLRQVIGWREYMRYLYEFHYDTLITSNRFNNDRMITNVKAWYTGTTGILILDSEIKKAMHYAYAHHISRLMVFLNIMTLCNVHPADIVKWFMEVISLDAYDWVMWSNVAAMGNFTDAFMSKPYISSSNYLRQMSNYSSTDPIWDALFYNRISEHSAEYPFYQRNIASRRHNTQKMLQQAQDFIQRCTRPLRSHP